MRALVLSGAGLNCERETAAALQLAGFRSEIVHIIDLIAAPEKLRQAQLLALVGGFSYGDHMGAALVLAEQMRRLGGALQDFIARDTLILGICNGCQLLLRLELLANSKWAFRANQSGRYECRWVHVRARLDTPFTRKGQIIPIPVAHAEGQLFGGDHQQISLSYCDQTWERQHEANTPSTPTAPKPTLPPSAPTKAASSPSCPTPNAPSSPGNTPKPTNPNSPALRLKIAP